MSLILKNTTRLFNLQPQTAIGIVVCANFFDEIGKHCIVTSAWDSQHRPGSLHYVGCAFDLRTRHLDDIEASAVADEIRNRLGRDFDVVLESDHIHVEWQPKDNQP